MAPRTVIPLPLPPGSSSVHVDDNNTEEEEEEETRRARAAQNLQSRFGKWPISAPKRSRFDACSPRRSREPVEENCESTSAVAALFHASRSTFFAPPSLARTVSLPRSAFSTSRREIDARIEILPSLLFSRMDQNEIIICEINFGGLPIFTFTFKPRSRIFEINIHKYRYFRRKRF